MKLNEWMKKYDVDQYTLADSCMISKGYLNGILNGTFRPSKRLASVICEMTEGECTMEEIRGQDRTVRPRCPTCHQFMKQI